MTFLLARRRSPWATALLLLLALVAVGGIYAVASGSTQAEATSPSASTTQIEEGRELFLEGCSTCHGLNADGAFQPDGTVAGPSLIGVGAASVDFQVATGRMPLAAPWGPGRAQAAGLQRGGDRSAGRVHRVARRRSGHPQPRAVRHHRASRRRSSPSAASCSAPTARPATTSPARAGR